jgi:hypothetical protein
MMVRVVVVATWSRSFGRAAQRGPARDSLAADAPLAGRPALAISRGLGPLKERYVHAH